jgi:hypothetical protein
VSGRARFTRKQDYAIGLLVGSRSNDPTTSDGIVSAETYYDREVHVAYIHWKVARALRDKGVVTFGPPDPDHGTEITLREKSS